MHPFAHGLQRGRATLRRPPTASPPPLSVGQRPYSVVHPAAHGLQRGRATLRRPPVASGGWPGLSGVHGRRGARRNRGVARQNRALPARDRARKGWARWGHSREWAKPYSVGQQPYSVVHPAAPGLQRGRATFRGPPGGSESLRKILTMPPHWRRGNSTVPSPCGYGRSGQIPIPLGNAPIPSCGPPPMASREAGPPSGGHWRPPGGTDLSLIHI